MGSALLFLTVSVSPGHFGKAILGGSVILCAKSPCLPLPTLRKLKNPRPGRAEGFEIALS